MDWNKLKNITPLESMTAKRLILKIDSHFFIPKSLQLFSSPKRLSMEQQANDGFVCSSVCRTEPVYGMGSKQPQSNGGNKIYWSALVKHDVYRRRFDSVSCAKK